MSKLGCIIPDELDERLHRFIPWGSKGDIITELLWQLADKCSKDGGKCVYELLQSSADRAKNGGPTAVSN